MLHTVSVKDRLPVCSPMQSSRLSVTLQWTEVICCVWTSVSCQPATAEFPASKIPAIITHHLLCYSDITYLT